MLSLAAPFKRGPWGGGELLASYAALQAPPGALPPWMTYYWIGHSDDLTTTRQPGLRHCLTIAIALRSVVGSAYGDYLMILISYTESNYGIGYIER